MQFGWDISTSVVGVAILDDDGKWVKSSYFEFAKMAKGAKTLHEKMFACENWIYDLLSNYPIGYHHHFFEDRLANFSFGKTMMQTLMMLAAFNALFSYRVMQIHDGLFADKLGEHGVKSTYLHPSTVKAIMKKDGLIIPKGADKKLLTLHFARRNVPDFPVEYTRTGSPKPFCYDMADGYIVARAGHLRKHQGKDGKIQEAEGD